MICQLSKNYLLGGSTVCSNLEVGVNKLDLQKLWDNPQYGVEQMVA